MDRPAGAVVCLPMLAKLDEKVETDLPVRVLEREGPGGRAGQAPLVGAESIFGNRSVESTRTESGVRHLKGFEPAPIPLLRFDVGMKQRSTESGALVLMEFSQPERKRPYLAGQFVWLLKDGPDGTAVLREEINTATARGIVSRPLHGSSPSFRRWLFFAGGHQRLMKEVAANLRSLLAARIKVQ